MANGSSAGAGVLKQNWGTFPAGSGINFLTVVNDDGSYKVLVAQQKSNKVLDASYSDKGAYQSEFLDVMDPAETSDGAPPASAKTALKGEEVDSAVDRILAGEEVEEVL